MALVVVDMQHAYFEEPVLAAVREELLAAVNELVAAARAADRPVVLVRTEHAEDGTTWTLNMLDDGEGFAFPGSRQARHLDGLDTAGGIDVVKTRDSAFHGTSLRRVLDDHGAGRLLLCGVSTHSCIAQTAMAAFAEDLRAGVARQAIASENQPLSEAMLDFLAEEMRQPVLGGRQAVAALRRGSFDE